MPYSPTSDSHRMRAAIVGAYDFNLQHFLAASYDLVVAADAGYAHLERAHIACDMALGDFDSLGYVPKDVPTKVFPRQKDESDLSLALKYAYDAGYTDIAIYGVLGGRIDQTFATIGSLAAYARKGAHVCAIADVPTSALPSARRGQTPSFSHGECAVVLSGPEAIEFDANAHGPFSLFSLDTYSTGVSERGLTYSLSNARIGNGTSLGLSNEFTGQKAVISVDEGTLLVIVDASCEAHMRYVDVS